MLTAFWTCPKPTTAWHAENLRRESSISGPRRFLECPNQMHALIAFAHMPNSSLAASPVTSINTQTYSNSLKTKDTIVRNLALRCDRPPRKLRRPSQAQYKGTAQWNWPVRQQTCFRPRSGEVNIDIVPSPEHMEISGDDISSVEAWSIVIT